MDEIKIVDSVRLKRELIHPNKFNPNEESDEVFNMLCEEIKRDGFDHPLNVVPCECELIAGPHYMIIAGEHRWKFATLHGMPEVPAFINKDWDEVEQRLKLVRRNLMSGDLNPVKFTKLVNSLRDRIDPSSMPKMFGFTTENEFNKFLVVEKTSAKEKSFIDGLMAESKKSVVAVESLTAAVAGLFATCAETIDQNYLVFTYKGSLQTVVLCDVELMRSLKKMTDHLNTTGGTATEFLIQAINEAV